MLLNSIAIQPNKMRYSKILYYPQQVWDLQVNSNFSAMRI